MDLASLNLNPRVLAQIAFGSDDELKALGRLTLSFSAADDVLTGCTTALLAPRIATRMPSVTQAQIENLVAKWQFPKRLKWLRLEFVHIGTALSVDVTTILRVIDRGHGLAHHRHDIVHGLLIWDYDEQQVVFSNKAKGRSRTADAENLKALGDDLVHWALDLSNEFHNFIHTILSKHQQRLVLEGRTPKRPVP